MAFCANCGSPVDGPFCGKCGTRVGAAPAPQPQAPAPAGPPVYEPPPGAPQASGPKKRGPLFWVLTGCGGLIVLAGIGIAVMMMIGYQKLKQAGVDPALLQSNPALAIAKMVAATNPDIEVLGVDEQRGIIKVRNKKDGKTLTMDFAEAKKGKIVFLDDNNQRVELQAQGEGDKASLEIRGAEGSVKFGAGAVQLPDWLPAYPGAASTGDVGAASKEAEGAMITLKSSDPVEKVGAFYEQAFKKAGLEVQKTGEEGGPVTLTGANSANDRTAHVIVTGTPEGTLITITFEGKK